MIIHKMPNWKYYTKSKNKTKKKSKSKVKKKMSNSTPLTKRDVEFFHWLMKKYDFNRDNMYTWIVQRPAGWIKITLEDDALEAEVNFNDEEKVWVSPRAIIKVLTGEFIK